METTTGGAAPDPGQPRAVTGAQRGQDNEGAAASADGDAEEKADEAAKHEPASTDVVQQRRPANLLTVFVVQLQFDSQKVGQRPNAFGVAAGQRIVVVEGRDEREKLGSPGACRRFDLGLLQIAGELPGGASAKSDGEAGWHAIGEDQRELQQGSQRKQLPGDAFGDEENSCRGDQYSGPPGTAGRKAERWPRHSRKQGRPQHRGDDGRCEHDEPDRRGHEWVAAPRPKLLSCRRGTERHTSLSVPTEMS